MVSRRKNVIAGKSGFLFAIYSFASYKAGVPSASCIDKSLDIPDIKYAGSASIMTGFLYYEKAFKSKKFQNMRS